MQQFLLELTLMNPEMILGANAEETEWVVQHFSYWKEQCETGRALIVGRTQDATPNGYAIFRADSHEHADEIAQADPAIGKVFNYRVRPYKVALLGESAPFKP